MNKLERILVSIGALLLLLTFFFPIWKIDLNAPQYPEGIGLRIWVNQITGVSPNDLNNINKLNHYIGMKKIEPSSIPELEIMPYIIIGLVITGLLVAVFGSKKFLAFWLVLIVLLMVVGLYDYYLWGYDYGHDLDPHAPIKVPGMTYQPPLIGSKQLLNMESVSLPYIGSYIIGISFLIGIFVLFRERFVKNEQN